MKREEGTHDPVFSCFLNSVIERSRGFAASPVLQTHMPNGTTGVTSWQNLVQLSYSPLQSGERCTDPTLPLPPGSQTTG